MREQGEETMTRDAALDLLRAHVHAENLIKHCLASEAIMRSLALHFGEDARKWAIAGLLHDLDFEETRDTPERHGRRTAEILRENSVEEEIVEAIMAHNAEELGLQRIGRFQHALAAAETITGLIVATALVYPDRKLSGVKPSSVVKRMKKKDFARSVSREVIRECEEIGLTVPEFAELSLKAMQGVAADLDL